MKKQFLYLSVLVLVLVPFFYCTKNKAKKIAVLGFMHSPVHDTIESKMLEYLDSKGYNQERGYEIVLKNADGRSSDLPTLVQEIGLAKPSLLIAISTPAVQASVKKLNCPYIFSAVTDPVAVGIFDSLNEIKKDITGVSGIAPYEEQLKLLKEIHPNAKSIGFIFNPNDPPARYAYISLSRLAKQYKVEFIARPAINVLDVQEEALDLMNKVDLFLIATDNNAIKSFPHLLSLCIKNKKPLYSSESGSVVRGAIASCSVKYAELGIATARMAIKVLNGGKNIPMYNPTEFEIFINTDAAKQMGVHIPQNILNKADKIYPAIEKE